MRAVGLLAVLSLVLACGGKRTVGGKGAAKPDDQPEQTDEAEESDDSAMGRKERLDLEVTALEERAGYSLVTLIMIDETGSSSRTKVGEYPGDCKRIALDESKGSGVVGELLAALCSAEDGPGRDLRFVVRQGKLEVLEARWDSPDEERYYEQRKSIPLPSGARIEAEPISAEE